MLNFYHLWLHECALYQRGVYFLWLYQTQYWYYANGLYYEWLNIQTQYQLWLLHNGLYPYWLQMQQQYALWLNFNGIYPQWPHAQHYAETPSLPAGYDQSTAQPNIPDSRHAQAAGFLGGHIAESEPMWKPMRDEDLRKEMYNRPTIGEEMWKSTFRDEPWKNW